MSNEVPSRQEMFRRAWEGLKSQGWQTAWDENYQRCVYETADGKRCAWGWVDRCTTAAHSLRSVHGLHEDRFGIAADLSKDDLKFASSLQKVHDTVAVNVDRNLEEDLRAFAKEHGLSIPGEGE